MFNVSVLFVLVCLTEAEKSPVLRAASWLHERPHADVLTSLKLHLPATDLHHITAARREHKGNDSATVNYSMLKVCVCVYSR